MPKGRGGVRALRVWSLRVLYGVLGLLALLVLGLWLYLKAGSALLEGTLTVATLRDTVSVARDARGVPVISGNDRGDVAYATGFVHAQERFFQMDLLRREAAGELAEMFGLRALELDKSHRLHRFRARAELALAALPAADRQLLDRYVAGVNDGLNTLKAPPFEYVLAGSKPRAWAQADSLLVIWAMYFDLQGKQEARKLARGWLRDHTGAAQLALLLPAATDWDAPLDLPNVIVPPVAIPEAAPQWWGRPVQGAGVASAQTADASLPASAAAMLAIAGGAPADGVHANLGGNDVGSNNWAVGGSRSQDGVAIVSNDMHLGLSLPNTWYRLALQFPEAGASRRMVGVTLPGAPLVVAGSNGHLAWGFTNSYGDYVDLVEVDTDPARPGQVHSAAGWETPAMTVETILVKGAPAHRLTVRDTSLGPLRTVAGRDYAVHWAAHQPGAVNLNLRALESADTVASALVAAASMGVPAQNFVAGDDHGNIGWTVAGRLPRRTQDSMRSSFPLTVGASVAPWQGWLAPADYPRIINPPGAQLWTANSRQLMGAGSERIGDGGFDLGARSHQIRDDLTALGGSTNVHAVYAVSLDDRAIFLSGWRERAIAALDVGALVDHPKRVQFLHLLKSDWSGRASVDSAGYRLTRDFMHAMYGLVFAQADAAMSTLDPKASVAAATPRWPALLSRLLDEQPAAWLPKPYRNWNELQIAAIDRVIADLTLTRQPLALATWGQRNTASIAHQFAGSVPLLGRWLAAPPDMLAGDSHMPRVTAPKFGASERMTVAPGKEEQGVFNMPGGQSGNPLSPFFLAGHQDWVTGKTVPLLPGPARYTLRFEK